MAGAITDNVDKFMAGIKQLDKMANEGVKPTTSLHSENGWIAPNGDFYPCAPIMHDALAEILHEDGVKAIEKTYVRISRNNLSIGFRSSIQFIGHKITQKQRDVIWDWCQKHGEKAPEWLFSENELRG